MPTQTDYRNQYRQQNSWNVLRCNAFLRHIYNRTRTQYDLWICDTRVCLHIYLFAWECIYFVFICVVFLSFKLRENWNAAQQRYRARDRYTFRMFVMKMLIIWFICQYGNKKQINKWEAAASAAAVVATTITYWNLYFVSRSKSDVAYACIMYNVHKAMSF